MSSPESSQSGERSRSQSILDRAFHGPETTKAKIERSSWLQQPDASGSDSAQRAPDDEGSDAEPSAPARVGHQAAAPKSRWFSVLATAALVVLAFVIGWFARPDNANPVVETVQAAETVEVPEIDQTEQAEPAGQTDQTEETPRVEPPPTPTVVRFAPGTSTIDQSIRQQVSEFVNQLPTGTPIVVVGDGDPGSSGPLNDALGTFRVDMVIAELLDLGVEPGTIVAASATSSPTGPTGQVRLLPDLSGAPVASE